MTFPALPIKKTATVFDPDKTYIHAAKGHYQSVSGYLRSEHGMPDEDAQALCDRDLFECKVDLGGGLASLQGWALGNHIFVGSDDYHAKRNWQDPFPRRVERDVEPFVKAEVVSSAYTKTVKVPQYHRTTDREVLDTYYVNDFQESLPWLYVKIRLTADNAEPVEAEFRFKIAEYGVARLDQDPNNPGITVEADFFGYTHVWKNTLKPDTLTYKEVNNFGRQSHYRTITRIGFDTLYRQLKYSATPDGIDMWWHRFLCFNVPNPLDDKGIKAAHKKHATMLNALAAEFPTDYEFFRFLHDGKTFNKTSNNALLTTFLDSCEGDHRKMREALRHVRNVAFLQGSDPERCVYNAGGPLLERARVAYKATLRELCLALPGVGDKKQEAEAKADWTKRRDLAGQADGPVGEV